MSSDATENSMYSRILKLHRAPLSFFFFNFQRGEKIVLMWHHQRVPTWIQDLLTSLSLPSKQYQTLDPWREALTGVVPTNCADSCWLSLVHITSPLLLKLNSVKVKGIVNHQLQVWCVLNILTKWYSSSVDWMKKKHRIKWKLAYISSLVKSN